MYEGSFLNWHRHGWGVQRWAGGSVYRGAWDMDQQATGVFTDANGARWKGDFRTGQVERLEDEQPQHQQQQEEEENEQQRADETEQNDRRQHHQQEEKDHDSNVTHFPASSSYQAQVDPLSQTQPYPLTARDFASTQPASSSSGGFSSTQRLAPHSSRSRRSDNNVGGYSQQTPATAGHRVPGRPKKVPFMRRRENKQEREEREAREKEEERIVLKELKAATHLFLIAVPLQS